MATTMIFLRMKDGILPLFCAENQHALREAFYTDRERGVRTLFFLWNGRLLLMTFACLDDLYSP